jgi:hypothetical protein
MSFGARITNTSGAILIDPSYKNLSLAHKVTFSTSYQSIQEIGLANAVAPIIALSSTAAAGVIAVDKRNGVNYWYVCGTGAGTCTAYVFDLPVRAASGHGMMVFDESGAPVFNSAQGLLRVVEQFAVPFDYRYPGSFPTVTRNYNPGSYAVAIGVPRYQDYDGNYRITSDGVITYGNAVTVVRNVTYPGYNGNFPNYNPTYPSGDWMYQHGTQRLPAYSAANALTINVAGM